MAQRYGILLDVDGTLVDSNDAHARAWVDAFAEEGLPVEFDRVRACIGMGGDKLVPTVSGWSTEHGPGARVDARRPEIFRERYLPHLRPTPGAAGLVRRLCAERFAVAVATSAKSDEIHALLKIAGVDALIETIVTGDDADRSKPDPDIVSTAVAKIGLPPHRIWMLGDTPYDIEAAARARVRCIAVRCGGYGDDALRDAVAIFEDPADLLARWNSSPLAAGTQERPSLPP